MSQLNLLNAARKEWIDSITWDELAVCPFSTLGAGGLPRTDGRFSKTQGVVRHLFTRGEDKRAWKLHFISIRCLLVVTIRRARGYHHRAAAKP